MPAAPLAVALVGAGPWAEAVYAPMLAAGPETRLACVWSRRPQAARALAAAHGSEGVESFDALLERCDAVAFAVPPDVQAELACDRSDRSHHGTRRSAPLGLVGLRALEWGRE